MNKKLLCAAVGASLAFGAGAASAVFDPQNSYAFYPYVVKDANRTTVISLINGYQEGPGGKGDIHIQYWTKSTTAANTAACDPSSVFIPMTAEDILTFDTAGILGYPLFGDTTNPAPLGVAISYPAPRHGYLMADNLSGGTIAGYWLELDLANGGAVGDFAGTADNVSNFANMSRNLVLEYNTGSSIPNSTAVTFWPSSVASTAFTVTPLGTDMMNVENNQVVMQVFNQTPVQGAYDRNENGVDGTVPVTVRCVGRVTPAQLMPGVVANAAWAAQGGWGYLANLGDNASTAGDNDAMVYQVDSATAGGKFLSNATRIVTRPTN